MCQSIDYSKIDVDIRNEIKLLNDTGIETLGCCSGHMKVRPKWNRNFSHKYYKVRCLRNGFVINDRPYVMMKYTDKLAVALMKISTQRHIDSPGIEITLSSWRGVNRIAVHVRESHGFAIEYMKFILRYLAYKISKQNQ